MKGLLPLNTVSAQCEVIFVTVEGGHGLKQRLTAMGLRPGMKIKVLHSQSRGPYVVLAGDTRLVLGRGMVHKILVRLLKDKD